MQEKLTSRDRNFRNVGGIDSGADLVTKPLAREQLHVRKLNSQFVHDEVRVNDIGARQNGVLQALRGMVLPRCRELAAWNRTDMSPRTSHTTLKGGPSWNDFLARVTADAES